MAFPSLAAPARFTALGVLTLALLAAGSATSNAAVLEPVEVQFGVGDVNAAGFTTWTVPTNICAIDITAAGGNGGSAIERPGASPGRGAIISTRTSVDPGDVLTVAVGSRGHDGRPGGAPGGGTSLFQGGGGGGGWSGIATDAVPTQANVIVVAGAGGASGNWMTAHGGDAGSNAVDVWYEWGPATVGGGKAGTEAQGGAGGVGAASGWAGAALAGGMAESTGGGGGAGYFGGGGGAVFYVQSGGGGGSSYPFAASPDRLSYAIKQQTDPKDGWVTIAFDPRDAADTCMTPITTAQGPDGRPLSGQSLKAGDEFTVKGSNWPDGEVVTVSFESTPVTLGTVTTSNGAFAFTGHIPDDATSEAHHIVITPASGTLATFSFPVTVSAAAVAAAALPPTGTNDAVIVAGVATAAGALMLGGILLVWSRRLGVKTKQGTRPLA